VGGRAKPSRKRSGAAVRLLCDEMLTGIGRWLRAAGYDTAIAASGASDDDLLAQARAEGRVLLTCDRALAAQCTRGAVTLLSREGLDHAERTRQGAGPITLCPACGRVYWPGSHVRRMRAKLDRWRQMI
jgi:uncharacterized protein